MRKKIVALPLWYVVLAVGCSGGSGAPLAPDAGPDAASGDAGALEPVVATGGAPVGAEPLPPPLAGAGGLGGVGDAQGAVGPVADSGDVGGTGGLLVPPQPTTGGAAGSAGAGGSGGRLSQPGMPCDPQKCGGVPLAQCDCTLGVRSEPSCPTGVMETARCLSQCVGGSLGLGTHDIGCAG